MKKLMCELCGGVDIVKDGDLFVCQNCGTKYTVETGRKMLIEGTIKIDQSDNFKNLASLARDAIVDGRFDNAYNHSTEALIIDPNDAEMIAIQGLAVLGKEDFVTDIPSSCTNAMKRMFVLLDKNTDISYDEKKAVLNSIKKSLKSVDAIITSKYTEQIRILESQKVIVNSSGEIDATLQSFSGNIIKKQYAESKLEKIQAQRHHNEGIEAQITKIYEKKGKIIRFSNMYQSAIDTHINKYDEADRYNKEEQRKKYWEEHPDKKSELNSQLTDLQNQLNPILDNIKQKQNNITHIEEEIRESAYPLSIKRDQLKLQINELERQRANLNIFQYSEKKNITEKIALIREQIPSDKDVADEYNKLSKNKKDDIYNLKNEIMELDKQAGELKSKIYAINTELIIDR